MPVTYLRHPHGNLWYPMSGSYRWKSDLYPGMAMGQPRLRCQGCGKVTYRNEQEAQEAAVYISTTWKPQRPYYSSRCGWWHTTSRDAEAWLEEYHSRMPEPIALRDYQEASVQYLFDYFDNNDGNPIVALPTGTGKSIVIAEFIRRACTWYPGTQVLALTHVKELIEQNLGTLLRMWPTAPAGVYSAGLNRREHRADITFAGIQSVFRKPELFGTVHLVLIDECHLVSPRNESMYGSFLEALREVNPQLKVIGFSATPYRMKNGMLTDEGGLFTDMAFDLTSRESFNWLIRQGWICPLVPRQTSYELDVTGVRIQAGEFVLKELQERFDHDSVTHAALKEAAALAGDRKHWLVFASGIEHAEHVAAMLDSMFGISAEAVHSKLSDDVRDERIRAFKAGRIQALVNNNILTVGFDFPSIDCIVMLRPTASPGLWVQMLGRGTRPAPNKTDCLVLDFANNTKRLGPINDPVLPRKRGRGTPGIAPVRLCEKCMCYSHASSRFCENPLCGEEFPRTVKITSQASMQDLIAGSLPELVTHKVDRVVYKVHTKPGKPDSMRVTYYCGLRKFSEYVCLDHGGYATHLARNWWLLRCRWGVPPSVAAGMMAIDDLKVPTEITVAEKGKYPEICGFTFADGTTNGATR